MNTFKKRCIELRKRDFTLSEIVNATGRSKTSVYFHIRHIPLSSKKLKEIAIEAGVRGQKVAALRKGKAMRPFRMFRHWTPEIVLLVAHLLFDGGLSKSCVYNNRSEALIRRVTVLMKILYDYVPKVSVNSRTGVSRISYHNVALSSFFKQKTTELICNVQYLSREHQREFLRAFFDDEGCMDYRPHQNLRRIRGYQDDRAILKAVQKCLTCFGIEADLKGRNEVVISGKENLKKFQKEINFTKGVCINGNRSNSIWKESIEKRVLLDRAIKSFKK